MDILKKLDVEVKEILTSLPQQVIDWGAHAIGADKAWAKRYTGKGLVYGQADSGIDYNHPDLAPNMLKAKSFIDNTDGFDANFHGTHVAGIAAGCNNNVGIVGVAPDAKILSAKIFDKDGRNTSTAEFAALEWLANEGADVINMSYGGFIPNDIPAGAEYERKYKKFMDELEAAGIVLVAASGNGQSNVPITWDTVAWPARFDSVIAVGAISEQLERARFSSAGPAVEFAMPGVDIYSCYPGNRWMRASGTSMAAPKFSGCVLIVQQWALEVLGRKLTPAEVRKYLKEFALDLGLEGFDVEHGFGKVNIGKVGTRLYDKVKVKLDVPPTIIGGRTLTPLRPVVELCGGIFESFDNATKTMVFVLPDGRKVTMQVGNSEMVIES